MIFKTSSNTHKSQNSLYKLFVSSDSYFFKGVCYLMRHFLVFFLPFKTFSAGETLFFYERLKWDGNAACWVIWDRKQDDVVLCLVGVGTKLSYFLCLLYILYLIVFLIPFIFSFTFITTSNIYKTKNCQIKLFIK